LDFAVTGSTPGREILKEQEAASTVHPPSPRQVAQHCPAERRIVRRLGRISICPIEYPLQYARLIADHRHQIELALEAHQVGRRGKQVLKLGIQQP
jgi:hypothetical protein